MASSASFCGAVYFPGRRRWRGAGLGHENTSSGFNERQSRWYRDAIHVPSRSQLGIWRRPCGHFLGAGGRRGLPSGAACSAPAPPLPAPSLSLSPLSPKASEHTRPRGGKSTRAHSPFLLLVISPAPAHRQPSHHGLISQCLLLVSPLPGAAGRPQDIDAPLSSPQIYPSGPWRAGFSVRTEARWFGSTRL